MGWFMPQNSLCWAGVNFLVWSLWMGAVVEALVADAVGGVPLLQVQIKHVVGSAERVEETEVVELLVQVVEVLGQQGRAPALGILRRIGPRRLFHQREELPFHERPCRRGGDLGGRNGRAIGYFDGSWMHIGGLPSEGSSSRLSSRGFPAL